MRLGKQGHDYRSELVRSGLDGLPALPVRTVAGRELKRAGRYQRRKYNKQKVTFPHFIPLLRFRNFKTILNYTAMPPKNRQCKILWNPESRATGGSTVP